MDQTQPATPAWPSARRRLLRGSFSLPAVLAVHNGSALAARSNQFRCVLNQTPAGGGAAPNLTDTTQPWVRVQRYKEKGVSGRFYVKVSDLQTIATASGLGYSGPPGTQATVMIGGSSVTAFWLPWHSGGSNPTPTTNAILTANSSAAVLFQSASVGSPPVVTVTVVGFVMNGQSTPGSYRGASTQSCWTSIR